MPLLTGDEVKAAKRWLKKERGDYCQLGKSRKAQGLPGCGGITGRAYRKKHRRGFLLCHHDHNPANNPKDGSNWDLGCNSCNTLDGPHRGKSRVSRGLSPYATRRFALSREREREREKEATRSNEYARGTDNAYLLFHKRNRTKKKRFKKWVEEKVIQHGSWDYEDLSNAGAHEFDMDPQTTARWLRPMTSSSGQFTTIPAKNNEGEDVALLVFKPEYQHKVIDKSLIPKLPTITPEYIQDESTR